MPDNPIKRRESGSETTIYYDELYKKNSQPFEHNPLDILLGDVKNIFMREYPVLDVGGGNLNVALNLANMGYVLDVVDISAVAVENINSIAAKNGMNNLHGILGDISDIDVIDGTIRYGGIILSLVLHFLSPADAISVLKRLQHQTVVGGTHLLAVFINDGHLYDIYKWSHFYPSIEDIKQYYPEKNWKFIQPIKTKRVSILDRSSNKTHNCVSYFVIRKIAY